MSSRNQPQGPVVSDHAMWRFMHRGSPTATPFDVKAAWREGYAVDVAGKTYSEARYTVTQGSQVVLLRKDTHITTVVCAPQEQVRFRETPPTLVCTCGNHRRDQQLENCSECGGHGWSVKVTT